MIKCHYHLRMGRRRADPVEVATAFVTFVALQSGAAPPRTPAARRQAYARALWHRLPVEIQIALSAFFIAATIGTLLLAFAVLVSLAAHADGSRALTATVS
jgi:hypothetical protein